MGTDPLPASTGVCDEGYCHVIFFFTAGTHYGYSNAKVAELADAPDLGSGTARCGGSSPPFRTKKQESEFRSQKSEAMTMPGYDRHLVFSDI